MLAGMVEGNQVSSWRGVSLVARTASWATRRSLSPPAWTQVVRAGSPRTSAWAGRRARWDVLLGSAFVVLGLLFSGQVLAIFGLLPVWALAALLASRQPLMNFPFHSYGKADARSPSF